MTCFAHQANTRLDSAGGLSQEAEQDTCCYGRTDNTGNVGTHGVHEEEVAAVFLLAFLLRYAGCHRYGADTGRTDEGVNLGTFLEEQVHELGHEHTRGRTYTEGYDTYGKDTDGLQVEE
jgi:hypothetical protein